MSSIIECDGYYTGKLDDGRKLTVYRTIFGNDHLSIGDGFLIEGSWGHSNLFDDISCNGRVGPAQDAQPPVSRRTACASFLLCLGLCSYTITGRLRLDRLRSECASSVALRPISARECVLPLQFLDALLLVL